MDPVLNDFQAVKDTLDKLVSLASEAKKRQKQEQREALASSVKKAKTAIEEYRQDHKRRLAELHAAQLAKLTRLTSAVESASKELSDVLSSSHSALLRGLKDAESAMKASSEAVSACAPPAGAADGPDSEGGALAARARLQEELSGLMRDYMAGLDTDLQNIINACTPALVECGRNAASLVLRLETVLADDEALDKA